MATDSLTLDRIDRQILHALQISPRAPFARIATVLDVSEQTVARRYQRMRTHGGVRTVFGSDDHRLIGALSRDGRASWATLAEAVGVTQRQAATRVAELVTSGAVFFHLDVAQHVIGLRSVANLWFTVAPADLAAV